MSQRFLLHPLRFLFLGGATLAVATALNWERIKVHIDPYDEAMIARHLRGPEQALAQAGESLLAGNREEGIRLLEELATDLREVRLGMRLEGLRTETLDRLTAELLKAGENERALVWTEEFLEFNPRDFPALLRRAELHRRLGHAVEEFDDICAAYAVGAASGVAITPYVDAMARRGAREEVAVALLALGELGPLVIPVRDWEFRWASGPNFEFAAPAHAVLAPTENAARFECSLPLPESGLTMQGLRVDLPTASQLSLGALAIDLLTQTGATVTLNLDDLVVANHLSTRESGGLVAAGQPDPYVILQREGGPAVANVVQVTLRLELAPALPKSARALFEDGIHPVERARWTERFGAPLVSALEAGLGS